MSVTKMKKLVIPVHLCLNGSGPVTRRFGYAIPVEFEDRVVGFATYTPRVKRRSDDDEFNFSFDTDDRWAIAAHQARGRYEPVLVPSDDRTWEFQLKKIILHRLN